MLKRNSIYQNTILSFFVEQDHMEQRTADINTVLKKPIILIYVYFSKNIAGPDCPYPLITIEQKYIICFSR